ncbi:phage coat protein [Chromobacterium haemolyticum]|uniref:Phage coat protein n=2 Tax=Chromobacterium haemolyticum TaxID=394935 RepID=A0ABS3GNW9_9NEIS|nr:phage coat protein [Chromobacterium haemolyticum]MBK0415152.1 hypothetical protein [Chromobacterium haemolyticum]MBO0416634.1 hypothetical protein [Chromobacterium haemolyticum]MBO0499790.1 hypothetical protein [Chromobacterium haemolyticum]PTU69234.1 phage coat protein [Chromobacterium haemolyticum]
MMQHFKSFARFVVPAVLISIAVPAMAAGDGGVDTAGIIATLTTGLAAIAAIGAALLGLAGLSKLYGIVRAQLGR